MALCLNPEDLEIFPNQYLEREREGWKLTHSNHELWCQTQLYTFLNGEDFGTFKYQIIFLQNIITFCNFTAGQKDCFFYEARL